MQYDVFFQADYWGRITVQSNKIVKRTPQKGYKNKLESWSNSLEERLEGDLSNYFARFKNTGYWTIKQVETAN